MIVYRPQQRPLDPRRELDELRHAAARIAAGVAADHDDTVALLVAFGELEAGLVDALAEADDGMVDVLRATSVATGHLLRASWRRDVPAVHGAAAGCAALLAGCARRRLPARVTVTVPEGYAHYGLYPETYLEAAETFCAKERPSRAVVIGLRSIGTSLAGVVGAVLESHGCAVRTFTVRPSGDPTERRLAVSAGVSAAWNEWRDAWFLVVDEGPGLSGSSMACVVRHLAAQGVARDRVVLFPSWAPEIAQLTSAAARECWRTHRVQLASFEDVWLDSGRLLAVPPLVELRDVSAGRWRSQCYRDPAEYPAVQPQHERRKFLVRERGRSELLWLEFVGLGAHGRTKFDRARRLAGAGFTPPPLALRNGFLLRPFVAGRPVARRDAPRSLLAAAGRYLAYLSRQPAGPPSVPAASMLEMIHTNVREGLGDAWADRLDHDESLAAEACRAVALDARMLAHEWLATPSGYVKTDALHHHDDHFFPGYQDIAWDVAAASIELTRTANEAAQLVREYAVRSGDRDIVDRLPFHRLAYLAFRLGYATLAAQTLRRTDDGRRFAVLVERYAGLLRAEILRSGMRNPHEGRAAARPS